MPLSQLPLNRHRADEPITLVNTVNIYSPQLGWFFNLSIVFLSSFIKEYLGASVSADTDKLKATIDSQAKLIEEKEKEIQQLKKQVSNADGRKY